MDLPARLPPAALALLLALAAPAARAEPVVYILDPTNTFVHFEVLHFGTSTIRGRIGPVNGAVTLDREARRGELSLRIPTATVDAGFPAFNTRLRAADLLASEAYPEAFFVATQFRFEGDKVAEVRGEFTWRGVSQPLSLRAMRFSCRDDKSGPAPVQVCGGDFEAHLLRSEFGATFGLPLVADSVRLQVQVEGRRR